VLSINLFLILGLLQRYQDTLLQQLCRHDYRIRIQLPVVLDFLNALIVHFNICPQCPDIWIPWALLDRVANLLAATTLHVELVLLC